MVVRVMLRASHKKRSCITILFDRQHQEIATDYSTSCRRQINSAQTKYANIFWFFFANFVVAYFASRKITERGWSIKKVNFTFTRVQLIRYRLIINIIWRWQHTTIQTHIWSSLYVTNVAVRFSPPQNHQFRQIRRENVIYDLPMHDTFFNIIDDHTLILAGEYAFFWSSSASNSSDG